jgi:hypothetical protein
MLKNVYIQKMCIFAPHLKQFIITSMKKAAIFFLVIFMTVLSFGKNIPSKELTEYGKKAYQQRIFSDKPVIITDIEFIVMNSDTLIAIFNFDNNGFLVMSADNAAEPVLAYSRESRLNLADVAPATRYLIESYKQQIADIKRMGISATPQIASAWEAIGQNSPNSPNKSKSVVVEPMVSAKWNQSKYYNFYAPRDPESPAGYDGKVPAGCVAVAMAMIMYTLEYPYTGTSWHTNYTENYGDFTANFGTTTYHYEAMQDVLQNHNHEVAQLIAHCATAVDMNYAPEGSGAQSANVPGVIQSYFKYSSSSTYQSRHGIGQNNWKNLLKNELDNQFPIYYSGYSDEGGHAFVCDGYDSDDLFHFNFGWGGSGNGYFSLSDINGYSGGQACVFFHPNNNYPQFCTANTQVFDAVTGTITDQSGNQNYQDNSSCTYLIAPPNVDRFTVNIVSLATEAGVDTLTFWAGNPAHGQRIATFSGTEANHTFTAITDSLYVTFRTNETGTDAGWKFTYTARQTVPTCSGLSFSNNPSGTFSDGSGNENYQANANCSLAIDVLNAQWLKIYFSHLDLSPEDYIEIISLPSQELLAQYSGSVIPQELTVNGRRVKVNFISDNRLQRSGFTLHWTSNLAAGINELTHNKLILYPNPATVQLQIMNMQDRTDGNNDELRKGDNLEIYNMLGQKQLSIFNFQLATQTIDISSLSAGMYIVKVGDYIGKFIKE